MRAPLGLWLVAALGCPQGDVTLSKAPIDADGDGYSTEVDCDDAHATVNPDAAERCDELDNDCDGELDEEAIDASTWYVDVDGDAWGVEAGAVTACTAPLGTVAVAGDCNDADAAIHPDAPETDCADPVDYNCDGSSAYADVDADGAPACEDCDDADAGRSPLLAEVCDSADVDEDCSGLADDADSGVDPSGFATSYADGDGDGFGDAAQAVRGCDPPPGHVLDATDCDDADGAVNPGAPETCDAWDVDEDCSGAADDEDPGVDPAGFSTFYVDGDADGYGDPAAALPACDAPAGSVVDNTDCDDANLDVNPSAGEVCDAANLDEDCSGAADDDDPGVDAAGFASFHPDSDADGYGDALTSVSACDAPSGALVDGTDCDDGDGAVNPAATEACDDAIDNDCDGEVDEVCGETLYAEGASGVSAADAKLYGDATLDYLGTSLATGIDLDGDGAVNLVVGASGAANGKAYVYDGAFAATAASATAFDDAVIGGTTVHGVGISVIGLHDIDDDGRDELALYTSGGESLYLVEGEDVSGSFTVTDAALVYTSLTTTYTASSGGAFVATTGSHAWFAADSSADANAGQVYVYSGTALAYTFSGEAADDRAGASISGGPGSDVNGDGFDDAFLGAWGDDTTGSEGGAAYVVSGPPGGDLSLSAADLKIVGAAAGDGLGYSVCVAGDMNGDGAGDLLVGAVYADGGGASSGAVYLFSDLDPSAAPATDPGDALATIVGAGASDLLGWTETLATGDLDGDGKLDLVVGSQFADPGGLGSAGAAWLIAGPVTGTHDLADAADYTTTFVGDDASDSCGSALGVADLDADGFADLLLGCGFGDEGSTADLGTVYFFGGG